MTILWCDRPFDLNCSAHFLWYIHGNVVHCSIICIYLHCVLPGTGYPVPAIAFGLPVSIVACIAKHMLSLHTQSGHSTPKSSNLQKFP